MAKDNVAYLCEEGGAFDPPKYIWLFISLLSLSRGPEYRGNLPSFSDVLLLFQQKKLPVPVIEHSLAVAYTAMQFMLWLPVKIRGHMDLSLLVAASLLHDIERLQPNHASKGADFVCSRGYSSLAPLIGSHMDFAFKRGDVLTEAAILYLADKTCKGKQWVKLKERMAESINTYGNILEIQHRFAAAFAVRQAFVKTVDPRMISDETNFLWQIICEEEAYLGEM